jgi:phosphoribosyl 1,2-cyclic phosphodiesterase
MKVTFWGVRGSIPTPQHANLEIGGETACVEIESEGNRIVLDAGSGIRRLGHAMLQRLGPSQVECEILLSHFHWDHIQGIPYFAPLYREGLIRFHSHVPVETLHANLSLLMAEPFFPSPLDAAAATKNYYQFTWHSPFDIGPFHIVPFPLRHPQGCTGLRIECGGRTVVYATDYEHGDPASDAILQQYATEADVLISDAQYTPEEYPRFIGWGHTTWLEAAKMAARSNVRQLALFHHDPLRSDDRLQEIIGAAREVFSSTDAARERTTITIE